MTPIIRAYDAQIDSVDKVDRSLVARINTSGIDRFKTVIDPRGARLENYRRNPVVLWEHGKDPRRFSDPIGRNAWIRNSGGEGPRELLAKTRFLEDDFSQQRFEWYRDGVLNGFSVNILPDESCSSPPTREEMRSRPDLEACSMIYRSWDLAEYSGTTVPGNAECLSGQRASLLLSAVERGLWLPDDLRPIVEEKARTTTDSLGGLEIGGATVAPNSQQRFVRKKSNGKWGVFSESGKELGEHDSEEGAKKQLAAIEAHKHGSRAWIDHDGSVFIVRSSDGSMILSTADSQIADQCLAVMGQNRSFESTHHSIIQEIRTELASFRDDVVAMINLMVNGRV